jgi:hypothetical protein
MAVIHRLTGTKYKNTRIPIGMIPSRDINGKESIEKIS